MMNSNTSGGTSTSRWTALGRGMGAGSALGLVLLIGTGARPAPPSVGASSAATATVQSAFFSQSARSGRLEAGVLSLNRVSPAVLGVSDRPRSAIERLEVGHFSGSFSQRFSGEPPKAILTLSVGDDVHVIPFSVSAPIHDAAEATVTYLVTGVDPRLATPVDFGNATLTIDAGIDGPIPVQAHFKISIGSSPPLEETLDQPANKHITVGRSPSGQLDTEISPEALAGYTAITNLTNRRLMIDVTVDGGRPSVYQLDPRADLFLRL